MHSAIGTAFLGGSKMLFDQATPPILPSMYVSIDCPPLLEKQLHPHDDDVIIFDVLDGVLTVRQEGMELPSIHLKHPQLNNNKQTKLNNNSKQTKLSNKQS